MSHASIPPTLELTCIKVPGREYLTEKGVTTPTKALMRDTSGETSNSWKLLPNPARVIAGAKKIHSEVKELTPSENDLTIWRRFFQR